MKKKILLFHPWITSMGGCEHTIKEIVARLDKYDWTIATFDYEPEKTYPELKKLNVKVLSKKRNFFKLLGKDVSLYASILTKRIKNIKDYDLLIVSTAGVSELITLKNHDIPIISFCHTPLRAAYLFYEHYKKDLKGFEKIIFVPSIKIYKTLEKKAWKHLSAVVCHCENVKRRIVENRLFLEEKIFPIGGGVDTEVMKPTWKYEKYFLVPGRFQVYKRQDIAIKAFKQFKMFGGERFKLKVTGFQQDNNYVENLKQLAGGDSDIEFIFNPSDDEMRKLYQNCWAVLFTAKNEDFGFVPLEGMACGKPVISVNEGGPAETIINGKTGFLVEADVEKFADAMKKISSDGKIVRSMGKAARERSLNYDWKIFAENLDKLIKENLRNNKNEG